MLTDRNRVIRVGLILTEMYPFYGAVLAAESMRLANKYANRKVFDWTFVSENGEPVAASNGMSLTTEAAAEVKQLEYAFVIAGYDQDRTPHPRIKGLLRRLSRHGTVIGAVDSGSFVLAESGLLSGQPAAVHFESQSSFNHKYPTISLAESAVAISPKLMTCAGGVLVIRLILSITRERVGEDIAAKIEADFQLSALMPNRREALQSRAIRGHPRVDDVIGLMQRTVDAPVQLRELAQYSGCSVRQLTRAFNMRFGISPMRYYQQVRLTQARQLLYQGMQPISEVAICCGFTALSAFSRAFKAEFGQSPKKHMTTFRREGFSRMIPAIGMGKALDLKTTAMPRVADR